PGGRMSSSDCVTACRNPDTPCTPGWPEWVGPPLYGPAIATTGTLLLLVRSVLSLLCWFGESLPIPKSHLRNLVSSFGFIIFDKLAGL
ncbi:MAG: hypothetical protein KDD59_07880, partial [Bdellovibrionales bacterium]|nr:hypothetical protein [Bdellovibrionales bacterium]